VQVVGQFYIYLNTYISMYAGTNRWYNGRGSKINYVRSSIPHCLCEFVCVWGGGGDLYLYIHADQPRNSATVSSFNAISGDIGGSGYSKYCRDCHGRWGWGRVISGGGGKV